MSQASPWASQPGDLEAFMSTISPKGGWGNEAVEVGLWHCCDEIQKVGLVKQVLLIGDAPANTPQDVHSKRSGGYFGRLRSHSSLQYWSEDPRFSIPTTADEQVQHLVNLGVPVHAYWVSQRNGRERAFFEQVASTTGGQSGFLDVNSDTGKTELTDLLSKSVLATLDASGALVKAYNLKYGSAVHT